MMLRKSSDRGYFEIDWLKSYHSFSFGEYHDPKFMGFSDLRVLNHDFVAPASGFPKHPHRDMEIISYVLDGVIEHQDSMGNKAQIKAGEVQVMSAGTGVFHSEYNPDPKKPFELIQIWILPEKQGLKPGYTQKEFRSADRKNQWQLLVSKNGEGESLRINQDARIQAAVLSENQSLQTELDSSRKYWLQVAKGEIEVFDPKSMHSLELEKGDAIGLQAGEWPDLKIKSGKESEVLLFDLINH